MHFESKMLLKNILIWILIEYTAAFMCPNQTESTAICSQAVACKNSICYSDDPESNGANGHCCDPKFCADTRLDSYRDQYNVEMYKWKGDFTTVKGWKDRRIGNIEVTCPIPITALLSQNFPGYASMPIEEKYPYNQDAQWNEDGSVVVTPCQNNTECEYLNDETYAGYCFNSRNPTQRAGVDIMKFCYKLKQISNATEYLINPDSSGLKFCATNKGCSSTHFQGATYDSWFCHPTTKFVFTGSQNGVPFDGICIRTKSCPGEHLTYASRPSAGEQCRTDDLCANVGPATPGLNPRENYTPKCVNTKVEQTSQLLCCQERLPSCRIGETVIPRIPCNTTIDCNQNKNVNDFTEHNKWCDSKDKTCCESPSDTKIIYCPDDATPLRFERKCEGYKIGDKESGHCPIDKDDIKVHTNGICRLGHCCPSFFKNIGSTALSTYSFKTQQKCDSSNIVPKRFVFAYCDRETNSVVVIGRKDFDGKDWVNTDTTCDTNSDCAGSNVCVYHDQNTHYCYGLDKKSPKSFLEKYWIPLVVVVIVVAVVCSIVLICCCVNQKKSKEDSNKAEWWEQFYKDLDMDKLHQEIEEYLGRVSRNQEEIKRVPLKTADQFKKPKKEEEEGDDSSRMVINSSKAFGAYKLSMPNGDVYIASVSPGPNHMEGFLDIINEMKIGTIVVLADLKTLNEKNYLVEKKYDDFHIKKVVKKSAKSNFCHTTFEVVDERTSSKMNINHYQLLDWLERSPSTDVKSFLKMYKVLKKQKLVKRKYIWFGKQELKTLHVLIQDDGRPETANIFCCLFYCIQKMENDPKITLIQLLDEIYFKHKIIISAANNSLVYWLIHCITEVMIEEGLVKREKKMDLIKEKYHSTRARNIATEYGTVAIRS